MSSNSFKAGRLVHVVFPALVLFFPVSTSQAHGGVYRGPTGPSSGGPVNPGGGPTKSGAGVNTGWPQWRNWWNFNWDRVLDTRVRLASATSTFGKQGAAGVDWRAYRPMSVAEKVKLLLPPLLDSLRDKDAEVRAAAAIALGKLNVVGVVKPLLKRLGDKDTLVRNAACLALGLTRRAEIEEVLLKAFRSSVTKDNTRAWLAVSLGYLGTKPALSALIAKLKVLTGKSVKNAGKSVLLCSAAGLSVCNSPSVVPDIVNILERAEGRKSDVQGVLLVALGKIGDRRALSMVSRCLVHKKSNVRLGAVVGASLLAKPTDKEVVKQVMALAVESPHLSTRAIALIALGRIGGQEIRTWLGHSGIWNGKGIYASALETFVATGLVLAGGRARGNIDANEPAKRGAFSICHAMANDRTCVKRLSFLLGKEKNPGAFSEMALAAGMLQAEETKPQLQRILAREKRAEFRTAAAIALGFMGDVEAQEKVLKLLAEAPSARQQGPLLYAVTLFGRRSCIAGIVELLRNRRVQDSVRALCCVALGNIGDSRRYPVFSALTHDFPWPLGDSVLNGILQLY